MGSRHASHADLRAEYRQDAALDAREAELADELSYLEYLEQESARCLGCGGRMQVRRIDGGRAPGYEACCPECHTGDPEAHAHERAYTARAAHEAADLWDEAMAVARDERADTMPAPAPEGCEVGCG